MQMMQQGGFVFHHQLLLAVKLQLLNENVLFNAWLTGFGAVQFTLSYVCINAAQSAGYLLSVPSGFDLCKPILNTSLYRKCRVSFIEILTCLLAALQSGLV